jgi:hypothetical protein
MSPWLKLAVVYVAFMLFRSLLSIIKYQRLVQYHKKYMEFAITPNETFPTKKGQIIDLFKEAGVHDFTIGRIEPAGLGYVQTYNASGFANLTTLQEDIVVNIDRVFKEAIGVFKHRALQSVNPIFLG